MLASKKAPQALIRGALICENDFSGRGLFEGAYSEVGVYWRIYGNSNVDVAMTLLFGLPSQ